MKEIIDRLLEHHHLDEMTKHDAIARLIDLLSEEYPDCSVKFNKEHNCIDVSKNGKVQWQVYPSREEKNSKTYRYEKVSDINSIPPGTPVYIRKVEDGGHRYDYSDKSPLRKHVDYTETR